MSKLNVVAYYYTNSLGAGVALGYRNPADYAEGTKMDALVTLADAHAYAIERSNHSMQFWREAAVHRAKALAAQTRATEELREACDKLEEELQQVKQAAFKEACTADIKRVPVVTQHLPNAEFMAVAQGVPRAAFVSKEGKAKQRTEDTATAQGLRQHSIGSTYPVVVVGKPSNITFGARTVYRIEFAGLCSLWASNLAAQHWAESLARTYHQLGWDAAVAYFKKRVYYKGEIYV